MRDLRTRCALPFRLLAYPVHTPPPPSLPPPTFPYVGAFARVHAEPDSQSATDYYEVPSSWTYENFKVPPPDEQLDLQMELGASAFTHNAALARLHASSIAHFRASPITDLGASLIAHLRASPIADLRASSIADDGPEYYNMPAEYAPPPAHHSHNPLSSVWHCYQPPTPPLLRHPAYDSLLIPSPPDCPPPLPPRGVDPKRVRFTGVDIIVPSDSILPFDSEKLVRLSVGRRPPFSSDCNMAATNGNMAATNGYCSERGDYEMRKRWPPF